MTVPTLFEQLEGLGEPGVRHMLAMGKMGSTNGLGKEHRAAVEIWLAAKERESNNAFNAETVATAKDALSTAKDAAKAAQAAASAATAAAIEAASATKIARSNLNTAKAALAIAVIAAITAIVAIIKK